MTNKLVVIINSLKVTKIKKILLYEMKFLVLNYSCLQNPWLGGYHPQIPVLSVLCPQLNLLNPPQTKFVGMPLILDRYLKLFAIFQNFIYSIYVSWNSSWFSHSTEPGLGNTAWNTHLILRPKLWVSKPLSPSSVNCFGTMAALFFI